MPMLDPVIYEHAVTQFEPMYSDQREIMACRAALQTHRKSDIVQCMSTEEESHTICVLLWKGPAAADLNRYPPSN